MLGSSLVPLSWSHLSASAVLGAPISRPRQFLVLLLRCSERNPRRCSVPRAAPVLCTKPRGCSSIPRAASVSSGPRLDFSAPVPCSRPRPSCWLSLVPSVLGGPAVFLGLVSASVLRTKPRRVPRWCSSSVPRCSARDLLFSVLRPRCSHPVSFSFVLRLIVEYLIISKNASNSHLQPSLSI